MPGIADKDYLMKRNYEFMDKCTDIFNKYFPEANPDIARDIILEIALVRSKMELEYSNAILKVIKSIIDEAVKGE